MVPNFSILENGERVPTLRHCFLQTVSLNRERLPARICAADGLVYNAIYDSRIPEDKIEFDAIISFQNHTYGRFAVIRVAKEEDKHKPVDKPDNWKERK